MTGTCPDLLAALRVRERDLELDAMAVRSRIEEVRSMIDLIERPQRRGRPRKPEVIHDATGAIPPREQELQLLKMITPDTDDNGSAA